MAPYKMIQLDQKYHALMNEVAHSGTGKAALATSPAALRLCFEVLALASAIDKDCAVRLGAHGLSEGKFVLLFLLRNQSLGLSPHELAERAGVTRATITGLVDGLERDGFAEREPSPDDRRKLVVRLTAKGRSTAAATFETHTRWMAALFSDLPEDEMGTLSRLLARVWARTDAGASAHTTPLAQKKSNA